MNYYLTIDQEFAVMYDMTLTEVSCLAACFTLPTWSESYYIENKTWYWYSEDKMLKEFPLLFGVSKRVYKNLKILADKGFILLSNIGRKKILCFTEKCQRWGKPKLEHQTENGLQQTENGLQQTENGLQQTENGLHDYNIIDNITEDNNIRDEYGAKKEFSPSTSRTEKVKFSDEQGLTTENLHVKQSVIDKVDAAFSMLHFPVDDNEIKRLFFVLCCSVKWRNKTVSALQLNLNRVSKYEPSYIKKLIEDSIAGGWQGLVFSDTDRKYQDYMRMNKQSTQFGGTTFSVMSDEERSEALEYMNI